MIIGILFPDDPSVAEQFEHRTAWAKANGINPYASGPNLFVDTDQRLIYWSEIVPPRSKYPNGVGAVSTGFPPSVIAYGRTETADMGPRDDAPELVVQRVTPLHVDPPDSITTH